MPISSTQTVRHIGHHEEDRPGPNVAGQFDSFQRSYGMLVRLWDRYEFILAMLPCGLRNVTGSPVNPIAKF